jgi:hypothetical protein
MLRICVQVWGGAVPVFLELEQSEITTVGAAPQPLLVGTCQASHSFSQCNAPLQLLVPRVGYLYQLVDQVKEHFAQYAPTMDGRVWFDDGGTPVKWWALMCVCNAHSLSRRHHPAGALYDAAGAKGPWQLTVHFLSFPEEHIIA